MLVFRPIAAIAMTIKNLLISFKGFVTAAGRWKTVVTTEASKKNSTKKGKIFFRLTFAPSALCLSRRVRTNASTSVIGMIASVRVSLTIAAASSVLLPWIPSQACAAAVTEEVSLIAVPANRPKPSLDRPSSPPSVGKISAAITLNRKITEMDCAISSSSASMTGAVAAMAEPPQIEEPTPTSVAVLVGTFIILHKRKEISNEVEMVAKMIGRDCLPF